ncbi:MAG: hypothetical protein ACYSUS_07640, partial [Planctomycetota bacterium]
ELVSVKMQEEVVPAVVTETTETAAVPEAKSPDADHGLLDQLARQETDISTTQPVKEEKTVPQAEPENPVVKKDILDDLVSGDRQNGSTELTQPDQTEDTENA